MLGYGSGRGSARTGGPRGGAAAALNASGTSAVSDRAAGLLAAGDTAAGLATLTALFVALNADAGAMSAAELLAARAASLRVIDDDVRANPAAYSSPGAYPPPNPRLTYTPCP